jgi:N-acetylglucosamine-6-phosphate deacetylase
MDAIPTALRTMARFYAGHGVTAFLATTMTNPFEPIMAALRNIAVVRREGTGGAALLGAHVEGPFIAAERCGAQDPALVRRADAAEYAHFFDTGVVKLITLAPEFAESRELISYARAHGAVAAAGHTQARYAEMADAVALGLTQVTHLFNGMEPMHHRRPGAVGAALAMDDLYCQLIADNIHVHPAVLKLAVRAKGVERVILITDAMSGTGMPDGHYALGGLSVTVSEGIARIDNGTLAGSTLSMERAVCNIMEAANLSLFEALPMATSVPARSMGLRNKGSLAAGMDADLIILGDAVNVLLTMVAGEIVFLEPFEGRSAAQVPVLGRRCLRKVNGSSCSCWACVAAPRALAMSEMHRCCGSA